ncbi:oxysterol-binding protein-related protein 1B-like [Triticum urartu]|uniref:PH domain-containing protein n=3 Tax=Triticum urartu TaxID=4572 RepID=A0A8R7NZK1_TRIUA|nr:oxysterol-binding protein-related protein 1B-like [Triticum urartu]
MRAREMHPLCCLAADFCPGGGGAAEEDDGDCSPPPADGAAVAGVLHKWTNIGRGWRPRWFAIRGGVLAYSKIRRRVAAEEATPQPTEPAAGVRVIGGADRGAGERPIGFVHLKISSFSESKSDDKRFYIITPTKTLQLRTGCVKDRVAWIEALVSARSEYSLGGILPSDRNGGSFSTEKLRDRLHAEGVGAEIVKDCEQIVHSEFSQYHVQMKQRCESYLSFIGSLPRELEAVNSEDATIRGNPQSQLFKPDFSSSGKCSEYSNTESSEDAGKQEIGKMSDEDEFHFYDTRQSFSDSVASPDVKVRYLNYGNEACKFGDSLAADKTNEYLLSSAKRRSKLPEPVEKERSVSLWSMIKDNVGKDLTRVCLPVYFNEPLSSLQKCFEELEYSYLLDRAYECGLRGNGLMRILYVAAFAVSGYASTDSRPCKPFNPLLGETYEADYPEKGIRFFSEKVSHHPMAMACHCEGKGWKFWGDSNLKSKFWGQSIQVDPSGILTLEFDDGETFQWSKVTTTINNLIIGRVYCHHHGTMSISGNKKYSCKLMFKEQSFLERNPRQVQGFVKDADGTKVASLMGKWDESMYCVVSDDASKLNSHISHQSAGATLLWKKNEPPADPTRYNLSSFAITLNELTPGLKEKLPPTDSRLRPDQRHLENGEYEKANSEKLRLETRQRMARNMQESGWKPRWFQRDSEHGTYRYVGGYWEAREQTKWVGCSDIFGSFCDNPKPRVSTLYTSASV